MFRMLLIAVSSLGLLIGAAGSARASNNCPSGSRYEGNRAGGICIGLSGEGIVKRITNGQV